jgi:hypothetical protein
MRNKKAADSAAFFISYSSFTHSILIFHIDRKMKIIQRIKFQPTSSYDLIHGGRHARPYLAFLFGFMIHINDLPDEKIYNDYRIDKFFGKRTPKWYKR